MSAGTAGKTASSASSAWIAGWTWPVPCVARGREELPQRRRHIRGLPGDESAGESEMVSDPVLQEDDLELWSPTVRDVLAQPVRVRGRPIAHPRYVEIHMDTAPRVVAPQIDPGCVAPGHGRRGEDPGD
jgi:hypothetical protein